MAWFDFLPNRPAFGSSGFLIRKPFQNFHQVLVAAVADDQVSHAVFRQVLGFPLGIASGHHNPGSEVTPFYTPDVLPYLFVRTAGDGAGIAGYRSRQPIDLRFSRPHSTGQLSAGSPDICPTGSPYKGREVLRGQSPLKSKNSVFSRTPVG